VQPKSPAAKLVTSNCINQRTFSTPRIRVGNIHSAYLPAWAKKLWASRL